MIFSWLLPINDVNFYISIVVEDDDNERPRKPGRKPMANTPTVSCLRFCSA